MEYSFAKADQHGMEQFRCHSSFPLTFHTEPLIDI